MSKIGKSLFKHKFVQKYLSKYTACKIIRISVKNKNSKTQKQLIFILLHFWINVLKRLRKAKNLKRLA